MAYTTINKSTDYFNTLAYTGTGVNPTTFTGVGFQPDFCWFKARNFADPHQLYDSVRGVHKYVRSNETSVEGNDDGSLQAFTSDGFTLGNSGNVNGGTNQNLVAWNWKANGAGSANTDGSISSTVSANTTSGFSIVSYTGNNTNGATIGHGLGVAPKMIIVKNRDGAYDWITGTDAIGWTKYIELNTTIAATTDNKFYDTAPTSTIFTTAADAAVNSNSQNYIAYCFANVQGYSKFGSYVGNGNADGTFVYTGFKPAFLMIKNTTTGSTDWTICDSKRDGFNDNNKRLFANQNSVESGSNPWQMYSNGFKMTTTGSFVNASGSNYIYMAFAKAPLVGSNNVPCTAR